MFLNSAGGCRFTLTRLEQDGITVLSGGKFCNIDYLLTNYLVCTGKHLSKVFVQIERWGEVDCIKIWSLHLVRLCA